MACASVVALSGTAQASTTQPVTRPGAVPSPLSACPGSTLCLWLGSQFSGTLWEWPFGTFPHNRFVSVGSGPNDKASSFYNNRTDASEVAKNFPVSEPDVFCLTSQAVNSNFSGELWPDGSGFNDSVSSIDLATETAC
jgi:hypothetical protein